MWPASGSGDMKVEVSAETYQVRAHFKALNEAVLMVHTKILDIFPPISSLSAALFDDVSGLLSLLYSYRPEELFHTLETSNAFGGWTWQTCWEASEKWGKQKIISSSRVLLKVSIVEVAMHVFLF